MSRFRPLSPASAASPSKDLLEAIDTELGMIPNMLRTMANAPAVLDGYLHLRKSLAKGRLSAKTREQLALAVAEFNRCDYCVATHAVVGAAVGLSAEQIRDSRRGTSVDSRTNALIRFALKVAENRGGVTDRDIEQVRRAGFDDGAITEVVAQVALSIFANYFNQVAGTDADFPTAPALKPQTVTNR
jgi:uncharacterized peroxidase-related enzyme